MGKTEEKIKETNKKSKKQFSILGYSFWRIAAYFIIYSIAGYLIETVFGIITKGVWESRQGFVYGPFCCIYGLGAVVMILALQYFNKNYKSLFLGGFLVGSIVEYTVSLFGEMMLNLKWWDYSNMPLNINGRICVFYSMFWGILAIYLMKHVNPKVDKLIEKIKSKFSIKFVKRVILITIIFMIIDCGLTAFALKMFQLRMIKEHDLNIGDKEQVESEYNKYYGNEEMSKFIYTFFGNKKMMKTFPNLKVEEDNGNIIYFDSLNPDIQTYYVVVWDKAKVENRIELFRGE